MIARPEYRCHTANGQQSTNNSYDNNQRRFHLTECGHRADIVLSRTDLDLIQLCGIDRPAGKPLYLIVVKAQFVRRHLLDVLRQLPHYQRVQDTGLKPHPEQQYKQRWKRRPNCGHIAVMVGERM